MRFSDVGPPPWRIGAAEETATGAPSNAVVGSLDAAPAKLRRVYAQIDNRDLIATTYCAWEESRQTILSAPPRCRAAAEQKDGGHAPVRVATVDEAEKKGENR